MNPGGLPVWLQPRLPFFYGWIILACVCCVGFARQGPAVATLSIFIEPMTSEFGWSRTAMSAAVSLGGILAALTSPMLGPVLDRHGARAMLCWAVLTTAICTMLLSLTQSLLFFFVFFCIARMNFAGPFDLGIYGALNNWFVRRRGIATSISTVSLMIGLIAMPLIVQAAILYDGWRAGWLAVGLMVLVVGFLPTWALMVRRPEDMGLVPDGPVANSAHDGSGPTAIAEPTFTRAQALRTPAFWLLSLYTLLSYPVQAGVSLHQAPHLIERGIDPTTAAFIVSSFSLTSAISGFGFGLVVRRLTVRVCLVLTAIGLASGTAIMIWTHDALTGYVSAALFGLGIGGVITVLPIAWADYFGRRSFGAIRGVALSIQVVAQATGPLISGILRDYTGDYVLSLWVFVGIAGLAALAALLTVAPKPPQDGSGSPA
ncbi:MAG: MFS transporter [Hyphomicrobiaceae bacterium]